MAFLSGRGEVSSTEDPKARSKNSILPLHRMKCGRREQLYRDEAPNSYRDEALNSYRDTGLYLDFRG